MERTAADRVKDPIIGRLLDGRYLVGDRVARGGMATVYEATDTRLDRTVAVKVMHQGLGDDETFSRRFRREAQAAARLAHQNVVAVFDQGDDDGVLFLVMEFVSGITLRDLIRAESPIPPIKALAVIEPVLSALASAHHSGMIHRDVKPENVLLSDDGHVKVADFGLARAVNAETQHTGTGVLIGTVSYLSPELVVAGSADARADVYAAGVLIYEMLTGEKPHQADSPIQVAYKHVHEDIPKPSARVPGLPAYVDALVARATARDTTYRPMDAGVLLNQVRRVRSALEAGITDDPDLVADLLPRSVQRDPFEDTDGQMPRAIIDPSEDTGAWSPVDEFTEPPADDGPADPAGFAPYTSTSGAQAFEEVYDQENEHTTHLNGGGPPPTPPIAARRALPEPSSDTPYDEPAQRPARNGRRRRPMLLLILALVTAIVVGIGGWWFGVGRYTTTPGVINLKQSDARVKVQKAGLTFKVAGTRYSERVSAGAVLSTDPKPGSRILKSDTVEAVVSRGPERHAVPNVKGRVLASAQKTLKDSKLSVGRTIGRYDEKVKKGEIISTSPAVGTSLPRDTAVDLVVSKGRQPIKVPDFTNKNADDAKTSLEKLNLKVTLSNAYSDDVAKGNVIKQTPRGGTLFRNDNVALTVSRGPQLVEVPKVVGKNKKKAKQILKDAGFEVKVVKSATYIGLDYVLSTSPNGGEKVRKGSTITIRLV